jgi:signal transduction histidine kinase
MVKVELINQEIEADTAKARPFLSQKKFDLTKSFVDQVAEQAVRCHPQGQSRYGFHHEQTRDEQEFASVLCVALKRAVSAQKNWDFITVKPEVKIQSTLMTLHGQGWTVVRVVEAMDPVKAGLVMAIPSYAIEAYADLIWEVRDKVLLTFVPILLISLVFLGWLMTESLLRPLLKIKKRLLVYESRDLKERVEFKTGFAEFDDFVRVFNSLTQRLSASFMQAGRFSADASHELRTPLTILRGYVERAIVDCEDGSLEQVRLSQMSDEIERLITITDKLLLLSKADAGSLSLKLTRVNISDMMSQLVLDLKTFQDDLVITSNIQRSVFWYCDADLIRQVLNNLSSNAVNYNTEQGWIHVELHLHRSVLTIAFTNPSQHFSNDILDKAFERFYRGSSEHSRATDGHGLGLSLCDEIIHSHHGFISIKNVESNEVRVAIEINLESSAHPELQP